MTHEYIACWLHSDPRHPSPRTGFVCSTKDDTFPNVEPVQVLNACLTGPVTTALVYDTLDNRKVLVF